MATLHVTVTPQIPNGNNVPVTIVGDNVDPQTGNISLAANQAYDIVFNLAGGHGVTSWNLNTPFGNQAGGACPAPGTGANPPFNLTSGAGGISMVVHVDPSAAGQAEYRLSYNGSYSTDPIIIFS